MKISARNLSACLLANLLISLGFVRRAIRRVRNGEYILSVYFHKPTKEEFEACVRWLIKKKLNFLRPADIEAIIQGNRPFPKGAVLLTVDDGWESNETNIIEVANKYGVPVTIFVSTEPVEEGAYWWSYFIEAKNRKLRYPGLETLKEISNEERVSLVAQVKGKVSLQREAMTIEQVKKAAASDYVTIGGHTHTHPILRNCIDDQVFSELNHSKHKLETWIGKEVNYFAYPNGRYRDFGQREMQILQASNYKLAFSSQPKFLTKDSLQNNLALPRFGYLEGASFSENICRIVGVWKPFLHKLTNKKEEHIPQAGARQVIIPANKLPSDSQEMESYRIMNKQFP